MGKRTSLAVPVDSSRGPSQYYQHPEARLKLKQCLASPQKFEEALEYGFAATPLSPPMSPRNGPDFSDNHVQRFLKDSEFLDTSSQFGGLSSQGEHEGESSDGEDDEDDSLRGYIGFKDQAYDLKKSAKKSKSSRKSQTQHRKVLDGDMFGDREMTLRLTLTKPQLRDDGAASRVQTRAVKRDLPTVAALPSQRQPSVAREGQDDGNANKVHGLLRKLRSRQ